MRRPVWTPVRWLALADDVWLVCHDDRTGRLLLHPRTAGLAVAGAMLVELLADGLVTIKEQQVKAGSRVPADRVAQKIIALVKTEAGLLPVRMWLEYLATVALGWVAERLGAQQVVRRERTRTLLRRSVTVWEPVDFNQAAWPGVHIASAFRERHERGFAPRPRRTRRDRRGNLPPTPPPSASSPTSSPTRSPTPAGPGGSKPSPTSVWHPAATTASAASFSATATPTSIPPAPPPTSSPPPPAAATATSDTATASPPTDSSR